MTNPTLPRDWFPVAAGISAALLLLLGIAYVLLGPAAARVAGTGWPLVWVTIVRPDGGAPVPHRTIPPRNHHEQG